jgi:hypothetical protein
MAEEILNSIQKVLDYRNQQPRKSTTTTKTEFTATKNETLKLPPKLGAAYNVFDGEELLEQSIRSIRPLVSYVVVVYQTRSNFGEPCSVNLLPTLQRLRDKEHLIDEVIGYETNFHFSNDEKKHWISARATGTDLGGARYSDVADPFFNEISKREMGRLKCLENQCTHFMSMDTDEYYKKEQLSNVWKIIMIV